MQPTPSPFRLAEGPMVPVPRDPRGRRWRRSALRAGVVAAIGLVLVVAHRPLLTGYARLFRVDDPAPSDALVLLLGGQDHRPLTAAALYRQGLAPVVLMGSTGEHAPTGVDESRSTRAVLLRLGVPPEAIVTLPGVVTSTREEAMRVRDYARSHRLRRITVVTTAFHTARSRWVFRRVLRGTGIDIRMAASANPGFDESNWYTRDEGQVQYFSELIKTIYYWVTY